MVTFAVIALYLASVVVVSGLSYDEKRWRYAAAFHLACAVLLTKWTADALQWGLRWMRFDPPIVVAFALAVVPFGLVFWQLTLRRMNTPRHTPSINDDPVMRRYLEEKTRRARKRRQDDEAADNEDATTPTL